MRRALIIALLGTFSACSPAGPRDEYGQRYESYAAITAHRHTSYVAVLQETEPLPSPLTGKAILTVPDRSEILTVIRRARPGESEEYIQNNTNYMAVDSDMLPKVIERRKIFSEMQVFEGSGHQHLPPESGYLVEYLFDIRGAHIFMTEGPNLGAPADEGGERVELPRTWVGAPSDEATIRRILTQIEAHVRGQTN
jgi:hypothetical protein